MAVPHPSQLGLPGFASPGAPILQPRVQAAAFNTGMQFNLPNGSSAAPLSMFDRMTLPDTTHPFAPTDPNTWQDFNRPDVFPRGPPQDVQPFTQMVTAGARLGTFVTQQSGGVTSDSFTNANHYVPETPMLGKFVPGDFGFIHVGIGEDIKFKGSQHGFKQEKVVNLQTANLLLAKATEKHVRDMDVEDGKNNPGAEFKRGRFMDKWSVIGVGLSAEPNDKGSGQVLSVATGGNRDVLNVWASQKIMMTNTVGFMGKYIDRAEVRNGQYFPDLNAAEGYNLSNAPARIFQLVPHVVTSGGATPSADEMMSEDNDGILQQNTWMPIGTLQEHTRVTHGSTRNIFYDATEKANLSLVKLHFNTATPMVN